METVLINVENKSDVAFLIILAKKLGMSAKALKHSEVENWKLVQKTRDKKDNISLKEITKEVEIIRTKRYSK